MIKRYLRAILWRLLRTSKHIYYYFRITIYPVKLISGIKIPLKHGWAFVVKDHIIRGDYETEEFKIISSTLELSDRVLEIGTGLGYLSIYCSSIVGENNVTTFEANPYLSEYHQKIFTKNKVWPNVRYYAAGKVDGELVLYIDQKQFWASSLYPIKTKNLITVKVPVTGMNTLIDTIHPTYLIVDVEGYEHELIQAIHSFSSLKKIQIEIHPHLISQSQINEIIDLLKLNQFKMVSLYCSDRQLYFKKQMP